MTKEQIAALIAAKIAGQGSMVDIGGALPEILTALAENGISTDMTVAEQMQARKDLGLYYEEPGTEEKTVKWTNEPESETLPNYFKISEDTPEKDDIVSVSAYGQEYEFSLQDEDDGYSVVISSGGPLFICFRIVLNIDGGNSTGIYCSAGGSMYTLKYNVSVTVVSKVPERFLPVAWNQLVTEGTKIAEVMIGEETTDVFAPEGGGALPWLDLTGGYDIPIDGDEINLSSMISQADWEKLLTGEYAGIHTPENTGTFVSDHYRSLLFATKGLTGWGTIAKYCAFSDPVVTISEGEPDLVQQRTLFIVGNNINSVSIRRISIPTTVPGPFTLSALPTASMTTQAELDAIGLTASAINDITNGVYTGIKYSDTSGIMNSKFVFAPFKTAQRTLSSGNVNTTLSFDILGNNYNIGIVQVVGGSTTVTVTVTPLS